MPAAKLPAFYESFLYLVFHWVALATSWSILSGFAGYFSFGHGAFFGAGDVRDGHAPRPPGVPFLPTLPLAGLVAALLRGGGWARWSSACGGSGASCSRSSRSP